MAAKKRKAVLLTLLFLAASAGISYSADISGLRTSDAKKGAELIRTLKNINGKDKNGLTPLMYAVQNTDSAAAIEMIKELVKRKADLNLRDEGGRTAAILAFYNPDQKSAEDILRFLTGQEGINLKQRDYNMDNLQWHLFNLISKDEETYDGFASDVWMIINEKIDRGDFRDNQETVFFKILKQYLEKPTPFLRRNLRTQLGTIEDYIIYNPNLTGTSPLMLLTQARHSSKAEILQLMNEFIRRGAKTDARFPGDQTPLMTAVRNPNKEIALAAIDRLFKEKPDINAADINGKTALMLSAENPDKDTMLPVIETLLDKGADVNLRDGEGNSFFSYLMAADPKTARTVGLKYKKKFSIAADKKIIDIMLKRELELLGRKITIGAALLLLLAALGYWLKNLRLNKRNRTA